MSIPETLQSLASKALEWLPQLATPFRSMVRGCHPS